MHGPASLWIIALLEDVSTATGALAGLVIARSLLFRGAVDEPQNVPRRRAVKIGVLLSLLPLMWLSFGSVSGGWAEFFNQSSWYLRMLVAAGCGLCLGYSSGRVFGYIFDLVDEPEFVRPEPGAVAGGRSAGRRQAPQRPVGRTGAPPASAPVLRPAQGAVSTAAPGRDQNEERAALLRTLQDGPDFRRAAAATALALSCADSSDLQVIRALLVALRDESFGVLVRAESLLALYRVRGQSLPVEVEVEVRSDFPGGVDWDFVQSCERLLAEQDPGAE